MLCERCGQHPATVHMMEIINNQKNSTHLCEVCAREMQPQGFGFGVPQIHLHNFLAGLLNHELGGGKQEQKEASGRRCEKCGVPEEQIGKQGLLGCGDCYPFFEEKLRPLLRRIHGSIGHIGKVPERTGGHARLVKEISSLKNQIQEAVSKEDFEQAAQLRDRIHQMEKSLHDGGEDTVAQKDSK